MPVRSQHEALGVGRDRQRPRYLIWLELQRLAGELRGRVVRPVRDDDLRGPRRREARARLRPRPGSRARGRTAPGGRCRSRARTGPRGRRCVTWKASPSLARVSTVTPDFGGAGAIRIQQRKGGVPSAHREAIAARQRGQDRIIGDGVLTPSSTSALVPDDVRTRQLPFVFRDLYIPPPRAARRPPTTRRCRDFRCRSPSYSRRRPELRLDARYTSTAVRRQIQARRARRWGRRPR